VTLRLINTGYASHNLSIAGAEVGSTVVPAGEEATIVVNLPAGDYAIAGDVPGHGIAGITGVLHAE
jgi:uncharacterized cupredoxin-like copper-binding protein